jgi:hypothetical protein
MQKANPNPKWTELQLFAEAPLAVNAGEIPTEPLALVAKYVITVTSGTTFLPTLSAEYDHAPSPKDLENFHNQVTLYAKALDTQQAGNPNSRTYAGANANAFSGLSNAFQNAVANLDSFVAGSIKDGTNAPASKIKISIGISFRPLTITISAEF